MNTLLKKTSLTLSLALLLVACSKKDNEALSVKPPISVIPHTLAVTESVIQTRIRVPLDNLQQRLENDIPEMLYNSAGAEKQKCVRIFGKNHCEEFRVGGWAKRTGPIQVQALDNGYLRIKLPLQYKLKATSRGKLIGNLLKGVKFKTAAFTAIADIRPNISNDWQLQVSHTSKIIWQKKPVVKVIGMNISIQQLLEKPIEKALAKALNKQKTKLASENRLKQKVDEFWQKLQQPHQISNSLPLWLHTTPKALHLSQLRIENNALQLGLALKTSLRTTQEPKSTQANNSATPAPIRQAINHSTIHLSLPLALGYQQIQDSIKQGLQKKPVTLQEGNASIVINDVEVYPNNDRLVLAAKVTIKGFKGWFASKGEIYISGKPVVDNANHIVRLADVAFSRKLESPFWQVATQLLQKQLLESLKKSLVHDFSNDYDKLYASINQKLQGQKKGKLRLHGHLNSLQVKDIHPDLDELLLVLEANGAVDLELVE
ncbi:DUF4403 family protein [Leucothrix arctica]|uniref:DUF4403 family protein n=1 Tax=Leucothrix arctica TaxID=1481894 RepID=UPI0013048492|nr:DUF4403 family protein [Leucothrix arctica]